MRAWVVRFAGRRKSQARSCFVCARRQEPGSGEPGPNQTTRYCFARVDWPAGQIWMDHGLRGNRSVIQTGFWSGSLVHNKRDLTGQLYMRNRYYDPKSGRFTQEDPIGLAGGLNVYGFANGNPVTYSDPYGLTPKAIVAVGLYRAFATALRRYAARRAAEEAREEAASAPARAPNPWGATWLPRTPSGCERSSRGTAGAGSSHRSRRGRTGTCSAASGWPPPLSRHHDA